MRRKIKRTKNGSYKIGRLEIFPYVSFWGVGRFHIGSTTVLKLGHSRIFISKE